MVQFARLIVVQVAMVFLVGCSSESPNIANANSETVMVADYPAPTDRVSDFAAILTPAHRALLSEKLRKFEQRTGHQLVVTTVKTLSGRDIAAFATGLANAWGVGRKSENDGVVLLIAPNERQARIAVGSGLETKLTNHLSSQIMANKIIPRFREGDMSGGIDAGVDALIAELQ